MAPVISPVKLLSPSKDDWVIKVRIARVWKQHAYLKRDEITSLDMILVDEQGDKIHATVKKHLIGRFEEIVPEGSVCLISYFGVAENNFAFKMAPHYYKINFYRVTSVKPYAGEFAGAMFGLGFTSFASILSETTDGSHAVDIMGHVVSCSGLSVTSKEGKSVKRITFDMVDVDGIKLSCTLWDGLADQVSQFISQMGPATHVVVVVQLARIRVWQGTPFVTNCFFGTRVHINCDAPDVLDFLNRLTTGSDCVVVPELMSSSIPSLQKTFVTGCERLKIDHLREIKRANKYAVVGTIASIQKDQSWFYLACRVCKKGVEEDDPIKGKQVWACPKCDKVGVDVVYRFKIHVRVQDDTGAVSMVMFDQDVFSLIGKTATSMVEATPQADGEDSYPDALEKLVGKKLAFKVAVDWLNINNKSHSFTVVKASEDEVLIEKVLKTPVTCLVSAHGDVGENTAAVRGKRPLEELAVQDADCGVSSSAGRVLPKNEAN